MLESAQRLGRCMSSSQVPDSPRVRFGAFELDPSAGRLFKSGIPLKLQPQPFRVLLLLTRSAGRVVTREEIQKHLWGDSTFVDFERGINFSINQVRVALCDQAEKPRYIETIPRVGYRFIGTLETSPENSFENAPAASRSLHLVPDPDVGPRPAVSQGRWLRGPLPYLFLAIVAVAALAGWWANRHRGPSAETMNSTVIRSLAVLPLENLSGDPDQEYFAEGMTDELISDLAVQSNVRVISRTSVMQYSGTRKSVPQIARELNVDGIVEGSVARSGDRVRIRVQLIDARRDQHLWAAAYERNLNDVLELQAAAARDIASELKLELTGPQQVRLSTPRAVSPEVHELYLKGRYFWNKRDEPSLNKAVEYFRQAIAKDPDYAEAYAGLADSYILLFGYAPAPPPLALQNAKAAAEKALYLDDTLAEAHASLAILAPYFDWNWELSRKHYQRALELNPNYATAHHWYGDAYLEQMGKVDDAVAEIRKAQQLDPLSPIIATDLGKALIFARRYDDAITQLKQALELDSSFSLAHFWLYCAYLEKGMYSDALTELDKAKPLLGPSRYQAETAFLEARSGNTEQARKTLAHVLQISQREYINPAVIALACTALGEKDQAFAWLEKGYAEKLPFVASMKVVPALDPLRSDPRFADLVRRIGLPP